MGRMREREGESVSATGHQQFRPPPHSMSDAKMNKYAHTERGFGRAEFLIFNFWG